MNVYIRVYIYLCRQIIGIYIRYIFRNISMHTYVHMYDTHICV